MLGVAAIFVIVGAVVFMRLTDWGERPLFGERGDAADAEPRAELMAEVVAGPRAGEDADDDSNQAAFERVRTAMEKRWEDGKGAMDGPEQ